MGTSWQCDWMDLFLHDKVLKTSLVEKKGYRENRDTRNGDTRKMQIVFAIR